MYEWWTGKKEGKVVTDDLRERFYKAQIEPLERQERDEQIAEQLSVPPAIVPIRAQLKALEPKEEAAKSKRIQLERKLADVQSALKAANEEEQSLHWQAADLRWQIEGLKARQAQCGSMLLTEFFLEMMREWDKLRNAGADEYREGRKNLLTGKTKKSIWSNRPGIDRAISYIRAAMSQAEAMRSEPLTDAEITVRLDQLRKNIPDVGAWERFDVQGPQFLERGYDRYGGDVRLPANY